MIETLRTRPLFTDTDLQLPAQVKNLLYFNAYTSEQKWWSDQLYIDRVAPSPNIVRSFADHELSISNLEKMLRADVQHLVKELSLAENTTTYYMDISSEQFLGEGYGDESLSLMLSNFVQLLQEKGLNTSRALVEHLVFERVKTFFSEIAQNISKNPDAPKPIVIVTSPPDSLSAGYHGADSLKDFSAPESHHSFVYVMELESKGRVKVTQYRTWHNIEGLLELQAELGAPLEFDSTVSVTNQLFANSIIVEPEAGQTNEQIHAALQEVFYKNADSWVRRPDQAPVIENREAFDKEWQAFFNSFYLPKARKLYAKITPEIHENPDEKKLIMQQLELLFSFFIRAVEKRVHELNSNPQYTALLEKQILLEMLKYPENNAQLEQQLDNLKNPSQPKTLRQRHSAINKAYKIQVKHDVFGKKLSASELKWYKAHVGSVVSITNFVMGSAQCYTIAPFKTAADIAEKIGNSGETLSAFSRNIDKTSVAARKELYEDILRQDYIELNLPGAERVYMIPRSYLADPGCRVVEGGKVMGPCEMLLQDDPMALPMNQEDFNRFMQELAHSLAVDETLEEIFNEEDTTTADRIRPYLDELYKKIFKKSVGLNALLASTTFQLSSEAYKLPIDIYLTLKNSKNPLATLQEILERLEDENSANELLAA